MTVGVMTAPYAAQIEFEWPSAMTVMTAGGLTNSEIATEVMPRQTVTLPRRHPFQRQVMPVSSLNVVSGRNDVIEVEGTGGGVHETIKESWTEMLARCKGKQASNLLRQGKIDR